ncbi:hypothetical protein ENKO_089 [Klebsiella phage fENko-Kae01]|nr:hypothetical protein [Klebsiella phage fENko-Kae01]
MELELRPAPAFAWAENEKTGYRHVSVMNGSVKIFACISNKTMGKWESKVVPMGYTYSKFEVQELAELFSDLDDLMQYLERDEETTHDNILEFLGY